MDERLKLIQKTAELLAFHCNNMRYEIDMTALLFQDEAHIVFPDVADEEESKPILDKFEVLSAEGLLHYDPHGGENENNIVVKTADVNALLAELQSMESGKLEEKLEKKKREAELLAAVTEGRPFDYRRLPFDFNSGPYIPVPISREAKDGYKNLNQETPEQTLERLKKEGAIEYENDANQEWKRVKVINSERLIALTETQMKEQQRLKDATKCLWEITGQRFQVDKGKLKLQFNPNAKWRIQDRMQALKNAGALQYSVVQNAHGHEHDHHDAPHTLWVNEHVLEELEKHARIESEHAAQAAWSSHCRHRTFEKAELPAHHRH